MLVSSKQLILKAQKEKYAVGAFNTSDLEITKAIINAAQKLKSPVIIQTSERAIAYAGIEEISAIVREQAKKTKIPVALHLDHGSNLGLIAQCLNSGYTSVMYDGSKLSFGENMVLTRQAVEMAHRRKIVCEGELGHVGKVGLSSSDSSGLTDPNLVSEYVRLTNVDFLAVSIGSGHGNIGEEKLDLKLLKKIKSKTAIPLVLHGGSGVPDEDIKQAIKNGICKINIDTDIRHTFSKAILKITNRKTVGDPREIMGEVMAEIQKVVEEKIKLFGSEGRG